MTYYSSLLKTGMGGGLLKSFGLVEEKVYEADFFLDHIDYCIIPSECNYYFSAFISACRSITFALQSSMKGIDEFDAWYSVEQNRLRENSLARKFVEMRNVSQKVGEHFILNGKYYTDEDGRSRCKFYFGNDSNTYMPGENPREVLIRSVLNGDLDRKEDDVVTQCRVNFTLLLEILHECFDKFGSIIDPEKYYTVENIRIIGLSIEDIEESLGFPKGYTNIDGYSDEDRMRILRENEPASRIDNIFYKYLNRCRYESIDS